MNFIPIQGHHFTYSPNFTLLADSAKKGTMKHPSRKQAIKIENHHKFKHLYIINLNST